jgi:hypothetical protein
LFYFFGLRIGYGLGYAKSEVPERTPKMNMS